MAQDFSIPYQNAQGYTPPSSLSAMYGNATDANNLMSMSQWGKDAYGGFQLPGTGAPDISKLVPPAMTGLGAGGMNLAVNPQDAAGGGIMGWLQDNKDGLGLGIDLLKAGGSLWGAWNGMKQYDLAEDRFDFEKGAYNRNISNQAQSINTQLEDRQRARLGSTGDGNAAGNYASLDSYMAKNKVDGSPIG